MSLRLGDILVQRGVLTASQCGEILEAQAVRHEPFGSIAEELFGIDPRELEDAWAEQYESVTARVDPRTERMDLGVLAKVSRRQAWQFRMIPMRMDGREIMVCTSRADLPRALRFAYQHLGPDCYFVLTERESLDEALHRYYPILGIDEHPIAPRRGGRGAEEGSRVARGGDRPRRSAA